MGIIRRTGSAKYKQHGESPLIKQMATTISEGQHTGGGILKFIDIDKLKLDPRQVRRELRVAGITKDSVVQHVAGQLNLADESNPVRAELFQELLEFTATIDAEGLLQPISVNPSEDSDDEFDIEMGERRYFAHLLLRKREVQCIVRQSADRRRKKSRQLAENIHRKVLSLEDRLAALAEEERLKREGSNEGLTKQEIASILKVTERRADDYFVVMNAHEDIQKLIEEGHVTSIRLASKLARIDDPEKNREAIQRILDKSHSLGTLDLTKNEPVVSPKIPQQRKPGRPSRLIPLGTTGKPHVVRTIIAKFLGKRDFERNFGEINWAENNEAKKAWKQFVKQVEEQFDE